MDAFKLISDMHATHTFLHNLLKCLCLKMLRTEPQLINYVYKCRAKFHQNE